MLRATCVGTARHGEWLQQREGSLACPCLLLSSEIKKVNFPCVTGRDLVCSDKEMDLARVIL